MLPCPLTHRRSTRAAHGRRRPCARGFCIKWARSEPGAGPDTRCHFGPWETNRAEYQPREPTASGRRAGLRWEAPGPAAVTGDEGISERMVGERVSEAHSPDCDPGCALPRLSAPSCARAGPRGPPQREDTARLQEARAASLRPARSQDEQLRAGRRREKGGKDSGVLRAGVTGRVFQTAAAHQGGGLGYLEGFEDVRKRSKLSRLSLSHLLK